MNSYRIHLIIQVKLIEEKINSIKTKYFIIKLIIIALKLF